VDLHSRIDDTINAVARARKVVAAGKSVQVSSAEERDLMKTVASLWYQKHRPEMVASADTTVLAAVDAPLKRVFDSAAKSAARTTYVASLKAARKALLKLRDSLPASPVVPAPILATTDAPPSFAPLASDQRMQQIMERRWAECVACLRGGAYLAAVVMMGGLLESLFVSKQNRLTDKTLLIKAIRAPQFKGKTLPLQEWTLNHYIEVGNELGWIGEAAKRVSVVLRDYRNFVHPQAEYAQQINLVEQDARLLWDIAKNLTRELLASP
jgi:hypothetical protein